MQTTLDPNVSHPAAESLSAAWALQVTGAHLNHLSPTMGDEFEAELLSYK